MAQAYDLIPNLATTFTNLQRFNIKLNPKKCVFGVLKGKLLGYIVSERGIEANPKKIMAISNMGPIRNVKGMQRRLSGCPKSIHLPAQRTRDATLQAPQKDGHFHLD